MAPKSVVILLREPSEGEDKYEKGFSEAGLASYSIPVLETALTNLEELKTTIQDGTDYGGVIITSGRACEAWKEVVDGLQGESIDNPSASWQTKPFYVVGKGTGAALSAIHSQYPDSSAVPNPELIKGQECGNADQLGRFIVEDFQSKDAKLLYLTGDKNRDTLPNILRDGSVEFQPLKVYETRGSSSFPTNLRSTLEKARRDYPDGQDWWIVFFAPSAADFVLPYLQEHFNLPKDVPDTNSSLPRANIASIGPTTDTYLRETLQLHVGAMASKPTPEDLVQAIKSARSAL